MAVIVLMTIVHVFIMPYGSEQMNRLKTISYGVLVVKIYVGLYSLQSETRQTGLVVTMAISNFVFIGYWLYNFFLQALVGLFKNSPSLFSMLTCGMVDREKF